MATHLIPINHSEIIAAMSEVVLWGYPREMDDDDRKGFWFKAVRNGERIAWLWFHMLPIPGHGSFHIAVAPECRGTAAAFGALTAIRDIARQVGFSQVWALVDGQVAEYLTRMDKYGWQAHGDELFGLTIED